MLYKYKGSPLGFKDVSSSNRTVSGYFSTFDVLDSDGDIGRKGMFKKAIDSVGPKSAHPRVKYLVDHDITQVPGVLTELYEDAKGLAYVAQIGTHNLGVDFIKMAESGIITEHSYGYIPTKQNKTKEGNELLEVKLWEGSAMKTWGANQYTPLTGVKGLGQEDMLSRMVKRAATLEKFCRNTDATDETIELLLLEVKQLNQCIIDLTSSNPSADEAQGGQKQENDNEQAKKELKSLIELFN